MDCSTPGLPVHRQLLYSVGRFYFLYILSSHCCFNDGHSDWCEVVPHCSFDLIIHNVKHLFMCLLAIYLSIYIYVLWRNVCLVLLLIFQLGCLCLLLNCIKYLHILQITPYQFHHLEIFSPIPYVVFLFSDGFLCCAKACTFD